MAKAIAIANQKSGEGKATVVSLGIGLARAGNEIFLITIFRKMIE